MNMRLASKTNIVSKSNMANMTSIASTLNMTRFVYEDSFFVCAKYGRDLHSKKIPVI